MVDSWGNCEVWYSFVIHYFFISHDLLIMVYNSLCNDSSMTREQRTASQLPKSSNQSEFQKSACLHYIYYMVVRIIFHHLPSWDRAEKYLPAMLAIDVRASSFCARETRGTKAKFKTLAETFLLKAEGERKHENNGKTMGKQCETPYPHGMEET